MKLSPDEIAIVQKRVDESSINIESLRDDVLDHLCCVIEIKMERGEIFDNALREALHELAPEGLDEIQRETIFLLNSTKIILMKKVMYIVGLLSTMTFLTGWFFGIMALPGARDLSIYGFAVFAFIYVPMMAIDHFKTNIRIALSEKLKMISGFASALLIGVSGIFKSLHLPGTTTLLLAGAGLCIFGFLPFFFFSMYKKSIS